MKSLATFLFTLAASAGAVAADGPARGAGTGTALRALAEIDGDRGTFTAEERRKFAVLAQVLGTDPLAPPEPPSVISERS